MGNNFYWAHENEHKFLHIGKISGAGNYCHECGSTLCRDGTGRVHSISAGWLNSCPFCGTESEKLPLVSLFTWSMMKHKWDLENMVNDTRAVVVDDYRREYTAKEFLDMIEKKCPIQSQLPGVFS